MITPFQDAHTYLAMSDPYAYFEGYRPGPAPQRSPDDVTINNILRTNYLTQPIKYYCNEQFEYSVLKDGSGYLRIISFSDYLENAPFHDQAKALELALDEITKDLAHRPGLVIDIRINSGGSDIFATMIAGRLTDKTYLAYRKVARNDVVDKGGRTPAQDAWVTASSKQTFLGPVVLLTGTDSISAAETFTLALMGRPNKVVRVGEPTQGVFSDVLSRQLPNGWEMGLPNEIFLTEHGKAFDGPGISPDIHAPVFTDEDLKAGHDSALETAQKIISEYKRVQ